MSLLQHTGAEALTGAAVALCPHRPPCRRRKARVVEVPRDKMGQAPVEGGGCSFSSLNEGARAARAMGCA